MADIRRPLVIAVVSVLSSVSATAATRAYFVEPKTAANGWSEPGMTQYVGQTFVANVDSIRYIEWFVGEVSAGGQYKFDIMADGQLVCAGAESVPSRGWQWVKCSTFTGNLRFTKGKEYLLKVSHSAGESLNFVYRADDPYSWGEMEVSGGQAPANSDLCARVVGVMDTVPATYWGAYPYFPVGDERWGCTREAWTARAESAGLHQARLRVAWAWVDSAANNTWRYESVDVVKQHLDGLSGGCEVYANLYSCTKGTSTRYDFVPDTSQSSQWLRDTSIDAPPCGLWLDVDSANNYWAGFVRKTVEKYDDIRVWEIWNEPNILYQYWRKPNMRDYDPNLSEWQRCELYVRLCRVADSVIKYDPDVGDDSRRVLVGSIGDLDAEEIAGAETLKVKGRVWLQWMYDIAHGDSGVFWDGVAFHYYRSPSLDSFEQDAADIRAIMRAHDDYGELWITETGWPAESQGQPYSLETQANAVARVFTTAIASAANPEGGYDRVDWFCFRNTGNTEPFHHGMANVTMDLDSLKPSFYAFAQTGAELTGRRFNGRVLSSDTAVDNHSWVYEFENPVTGCRTWTAWVDAFAEMQDMRLAYPARTDEVDVAALAYYPNSTPVKMDAEESGWYLQTTPRRPLFVTERYTAEPPGTARPDIVVDSVGLGPGVAQVGRSLVAKVRFRNIGTDSTNIGDTANGRPNTVIRLYDDTTYVTQVSYSQSIAVGETVRVEVPWSTQVHGGRLLRVGVNEDQAYVEQGMDDNAGYVRTYVYRPPQAAVDVITPGNGRSDVPRVILNLSSISFENDSLPAESLLLLQAHYGISDSVPDTIIASGWFGAKSCTTWQFLAGEGHYRFACLAADSGGNVSDTAWHDTTFITFDSTPPAVSVAVNSGATFTNDASVLVSWAGTDNLSPACSVRLGNAELVNVVAGSGFGTSDTLWRFSGAQVDGTSGMVSLPLGVDAAAVWQVLPASAYGPLAGHWVRLAADALVQGWSGTDSTVGGLEYGYLYTAVGEQSPDTLFYAAVTVDIPTGPAACIGQDRLEYRFTCPSPSTIAEYELQSAYVRCLVGGSQADTGLVWLDNLKLERFGTDSVCSGWLPPDSVQNWTLSSGDGRKTVWLAVQDVSGNETRVETCDSINFDQTPPIALVSEPTDGSKVNGTFKLLGAAYDPLAGQGQDWFESYRLEYSHDNNDWQPVEPETDFFEPAVPTWDSSNLPPTYYPATLGYWNTAGLGEGECYVRLTVTDSAGNQSQDVTWYLIAGSGDGNPEDDAGGPDGGGSGLGEGSILVGSATGVLRVYDEELNVLSTRTVTDSGQAAYITAAVRHSPDTLILLNARAHTLLALGSAGEPVRLARGLALPTGIAKDASGAYWLTDKLSGRLARYERGEGLELVTDSLGGPEAVGTRGDRVYVAETRANRIAVFDTAGRRLPTITGGFTGPQAIALPSTGGIYLTEPQTGTIKGITSDGTVYYTLNNATVHKGLLASPDGTKLYTLKPAGNRVLSYRIRSSDSLPGGGQAAGAENLPRTLTLNSPRPNPSNRQTQLSYGLPKASRVSIRLYDAAGRQCANLADCQQKAGWYHLTWDGTGNGRALPAGVYFIQLSTDLGRMQKKLVRTQ